MKNKVVGVIIVIIIFICSVFFIIKKFQPNDSDEKMIIDAKEIMKIASYKYYRDLMGDSINAIYKCYNINELGININALKGINSKNYIGSVLVQGTSDDSRIIIWLSDGKRMATGVLNNVQVFKSQEVATTNCTITK